MTDPLPAPERPAYAAVLLHGRGQSPDFMLGLAARLNPPGTFVAPAAPEQSWYPNSFLAPLASNQPHLDAAIGRVDTEIQGLEQQGWTRDRIVLIGFSQGACLACEYLRRNPQAWGGLVAWTGGLIDLAAASRLQPGALSGLPILLTNGDADEWVPLERVERTAAVFLEAGADVDLRIYPGRAHDVVPEELHAAAYLLGRLAPNRLTARAAG